MANYLLSNEAKNDIIQIHQFGIRKFGSVQADKHIDNLFKCFDQIARRPLSFESVQYIKANYRRCVCGSESIYFNVHKKEIQIMTIIGRQDINQIL